MPVIASASASMCYGGQGLTEAIGQAIEREVFSYVAKL